MRAFGLIGLVLAASLCAASASAQQQPVTPTQAAPPETMIYADATPQYRFFPGDEIEIIVFSAPELNRTVTVAPDGRISLPLLQPIRAADLTTDELHDTLVAAYSSQLRTPELSVSAKSYASRQVFVGGEVARPGIYEMPANIDAFQAVMLAGGFLPTARRNDVLVMSRATGATTVSELDLSPRAMRRGFPDAQPLSRYDVVYVPRSGISQVNLFMQQYVRDALPVQFSFYYDLRGNRNN
ncbi:polysaccharide biosynthesis/export family protein [Terricaulis sp.]|uniref:polysaccharide biosynthesis/export family protein n=1 Tax=Terricaulis sp. TaxID=2768686 RepID=UPI003782DEAA